jgi:hypothetical protein
MRTNLGMGLDMGLNMGFTPGGSFGGHASSCAGLAYLGRQ